MTRAIWRILFGLELLLSAGALIAYALDKHYAKIPGHRRISERALLLWAFCGGAPGAWIAMEAFRHKTRHKRFTILVPLFALVQLGVLLMLFFMTA